MFFTDCMIVYVYIMSDISVCVYAMYVYALMGVFLAIYLLNRCVVQVCD